MNTKDIEKIVEEIRDKVRSIGIDSDEIGDVYIAGEDIEDICNTLRTTLTQHHEAEVERARQDICRNHLETLEDALNDPDLYGAINGMVHGLRTFLTPTKTDKQTDITSDK